MPHTWFTRVVDRVTQVIDVYVPWEIFQVPALVPSRKRGGGFIGEKLRRGRSGRVVNSSRFRIVIINYDQVPRFGPKRVGGWVNMTSWRIWN